MFSSCCADNTVSGRIPGQQTDEQWNVQPLDTCPVEAVIAVIDDDGAVTSNGQPPSPVVSVSLRPVSLSFPLIPVCPVAPVLLHIMIPIQHLPSL
mmetsp:Transcript_8418/g.14463  ORF Transcript_8418/g.14463 Transcript_8418/m.14463 type:complete len:95 (-) Transcript_8418:433-717(-)